MDFKKFYIAAVIVVFLFGIGVGYQLFDWFGDKDTEESATITNRTTTASDPTKASPKAQPVVYVRTGTVEDVSSNAVVFKTYVQNQDATYSSMLMTAAITDQTTLAKVFINNPKAANEAIKATDIKANDQISVEATENMYGKTQITAKSIQLQVN